MNRSSRIAAASAAIAVAGFGMAGVAQASGPSLSLSATTVMQGGTVNVTAMCPGKNAIAVLASQALPGVYVPLPSAGSGSWKVAWHIGRVMPGTYVVGLACGTSAGQLTGVTKTMLTVTKATKPVPPTPPGPRVVYGPTIVIHSGFGGLHGRVASHHPAS